jgi:hypothetical protein
VIPLVHVFQWSVNRIHNRSHDISLGEPIANYVTGNYRTNPQKMATEKAYLSASCGSRRC